MDCEPCCVRLRGAAHTLDFHLGRAHLARASQDLFAASASQLEEAGHPRDLWPLGVDRLAALASHWQASQISRATHKLSCALQQLALCGRGLEGGELTLHATSDEYVLLLSDGHLLLHADDAHCEIHLVAPVLRCQRVVSRAIDLTRFVGAGELAMVRSRAALTVKFGRATQCALWTRGTCRLELQRADQLALWSGVDARRYFPLAWRADSTLLGQRTFASLTRAQRVDADERATAYACLFDQADARCDLALEHGALALLPHYRALSERAWQWDPLGLRELSWLREHGSMEGDFGEERRLLETLGVLYRGDAQWPEFSVRHAKRKRLLSVQRARYQAAGEWYYVNALYFSERRDAVVAFFYLNLDEGRLLLIPPH